MKRFLPMLALAVLLSSCAVVFTSIKNPVTPANFAVAEAAYGAVLATAVNYKRACIAKLIPSSCRGIVIALQPYQAKAQSTVVTARHFIVANDTISAITAVQAAMVAVDALRSAALTFGVK